MSSNIRQHLIRRNGELSEHESTYRTHHCIGHYDKAFDLAVQRHPVRQSVLDLEEDSDSPIHFAEGYIYRAIATNRSALSDSEITHWYIQRAEDSENRIKELKLDFGGDSLVLPHYCIVLPFIRLNASIVTGRSSKPAGHYDPLAAIRHGHEIGQDGTRGMAKVTRRQRKST
jgi:hypothetical protein